MNRYRLPWTRGLTAGRVVGGGAWVGGGHGGYGYGVGVYGYGGRVWVQV